MIPEIEKNIPQTLLNTFESLAGEQADNREHNEEEMWRYRLSLSILHKAYHIIVKHLAGSEGDAEEIAQRFVKENGTDFVFPNATRNLLICDIQQHTAIHTAQLLLKVQELEKKIKDLEDSEEQLINEANRV